MKLRLKRKLSVLLTGALALSSINIGSLYAAEVDNAEKTIVGLENLNEKYALQKLPIGADEEDIKFPAGIWADMLIEKIEDEEDKTAVNPTEEDKTEEDKTEEDKTEEDETEEDETEKEAEKETEEDEKLTDDVATEGDVTSSQRKPATPSQAEASERDKKKTEKKTIRKKIKEIEWELNFVESTEQKFISDIEGTYVYEPVIPSGYEMDIDVSLPQIKVIVEDETEKDGLVLTAEAGDYLVMVSADTDVFPEDVSLLVKLIESKDATENLKQALEELEGNINIADEDLVYFDVTVLDKDGNEVQPDNEKGSITISFENLIEQTEGAERTKVQDYQIYHLDEENQVMEKRDTTVTEQVVQAEMEHFSPVVVRIGRSTGTVSVSNATELISALTNTTGSSITLSDDIKLENMVTMKADHTLVIPSGKTLTIIETLSAGGKILSIQGGGAVRMQGRALRGKIELKDITVWLETEKDNGIRADILNVNAGAKIVVDSSEHKNLISVASSKTLNVNEGGSIEIENFHESAIICDGTININNGGTIAINASGKGNNPSGINLTRNGKINIDGGVLISENSGSIYLIEGSKVQGMANKLSDQGKTFNSGNEVTVGAADTAAADNQLTAGLYVGDRENKFVKASAAATGLKDGILTLTSQAGGVKSEGWNWNKNNLDLNSDFKGCKQIVFATESPAQIKINRGEVKIDGSESAIVVPKDLTIWSNADNNAKLTVNGKIEVQGNVIIDQSTSMDVTANSSDAAFQAGADSTIKISADAKVTVRNQGSGAAMNKAPDTSGYTNIKIIASTDSSGSPKVKYDADGISQYKYLKIEKGSSLNEDSTVDEIVEAVKNMNSDDPDEIDKVANIIREMDPAKRKNMNPETLEKVEQLLQEATGITPATQLVIPPEITGKKQIEGAEISGALLAAGITTTDTGKQVKFNVVQKQPETGAVVTFDCTLSKNGNPVTLAVPVTVKVMLPGEYIAGERIHHVGNGIDEWLDFIYDGKDNSATFQTSSFSTFSIMKPSSSNSSGGGGGHSHSSGGPRSRFAATTAKGGKWIQDATGWWYQNADRTYPKDGWFQLETLGKNEWYHFNKNGYMVTGWVFTNGKWYYLNTALDATNGKMLTSWQLIDGKWYYLNEASDGTRGARLTDTWVGEYYLNKEGVWEEGKKK